MNKLFKIISGFMILGLLSCAQPQAKGLSISMSSTVQIDKEDRALIDAAANTFKSQVLAMFSKQLEQMKCNNDEPVIFNIEELYVLKTKDLAIIIFTILMGDVRVINGYATLAKHDDGITWGLGPTLVFKDIGFSDFIKKCIVSKVVKPTVQLEND